MLSFSHSQIFIFFSIMSNLNLSCCDSRFTSCAIHIGLVIQIILLLLHISQLLSFLSQSSSLLGRIAVVLSSFFHRSDRFHCSLLTSALGPYVFLRTLVKNLTQYITESLTTTKQNSDHVFVLSSLKKIVNYWFGVLFFLFFGVFFSFFW